MADATFRSLIDHIPWGAECDPIWPSSSLTLRRNLAAYCFPSKLEEREATELVLLIKELYLKSPHFEGPSFFSSVDLSPLDKELIFEHFLTFEPAEMGRGQALLLEKSGNFLGLINSNDHLTLRLACEAGTWQKGWKTVSDFSNSLSEKLPFAFSGRFGYLTSEFRHCGTGLTARAILHIPALIHSHKLTSLADEIKESGLTIKGIDANTEAFTGDLVILQNHFKIGVAEDELLRNVYSCAKKWVTLEKELRASLISEKNAHFKDLISRAFGLLTHSYEIHAKETLDALSLLKLGIHLGWVDQIADHEIFQLMFLTRRAHLLQSLNLQIPKEDLPHKRSEFLHQKLQNSKLLI